MTRNFHSYTVPRIFHHNESGRLADWPHRPGLIEEWPYFFDRHHIAIACTAAFGAYDGSLENRNGLAVLHPFFRRLRLFKTVPTDPINLAEIAA